MQNNIPTQVFAVNEELAKEVFAETTGISNLLMLCQLEYIEQYEEGVNWNEEEDGFTSYYWDLNVSQMWTDTEYVPSKDKPQWDSDERMVKYKETYKRVLAGLTLLDTKQGNIGVPSLIEITDSKQRKALLTFMAMMEQIHAKSYSTIYTTLLTVRETNRMFKWANENQYIQKKSDIISHYYLNFDKDSKVSQYMTYVASVLLESFLFYSGFFLPLYLSGGMNLMVHSGTIIKKIQDDEKLHGAYIGLIAQELFAEMTEKEQKIATLETQMLINELWCNEVDYTRELYTELNLVEEVVEFLKYNLNHAMENLGLEVPFEGVTINVAVENALDEDTTTGDVFSLKLKKYFKAKSRPLENSDFKYELEELI